MNGWWHHPGDTWIAVIAAFAASACALPGSFLVLRRMGMMGDAISHAVLPGIIGGFLMAAAVPPGAPMIGGIDPRHPLVMLVGAALAGLLAALLIEVLHTKARTERGSAMGIVLTGFFAVGLVLVRRAADSHRVDLDPDCVLYGSIELARLDTWLVGGLEVPRAVIVLGLCTAVNGLIMLLLVRALAAAAFDAAHASASGIRAHRAHILLMAMTAATTVTAFEVVGSILVVAMLVVPAAAARLLTDRLGVMLVLSVVIGVIGAFGGHAMAITVPTWFGFEETLTSGSVAVMLGILLVGAVFLSPLDGLLVRRVRRHALRTRILREDLLGWMFRREEGGRIGIPPAEITAIGVRLGAGARQTSAALRGLQREGRVRFGTGAMMRLTDQGRRDASKLVRAHRLWESYLVTHADLRPDHVHRIAMELEHVTDEAGLRELAARAADVPHDPHGRKIPGS